MKFISDNKSSFSIEITPLIDIVFLLVIFFVVTSKVGDSQFLSLELPKTESFQYKTVQSSNEIVIINNGSIFINNKVFNVEYSLLAEYNSWQNSHAKVQGHSGMRYVS